MTEIHTIPVPDGWSVEQAWEAISRGETLQGRTPSWANVEVEDGRLVKWLPVALCSTCNVDSDGTAIWGGKGAPECPDCHGSGLRSGVGVSCGRCGSEAVYMATCNSFYGTGHEWVLASLCDCCKVVFWSDERCHDCTTASSTFDSPEASE